MLYIILLEIIKKKLIHAKIIVIMMTVNDDIESNNIMDKVCINIYN